MIEDRRIAKRRKYARRMRRSKEAVSPVVATLMLILIAVAAAASLYLWLSGWQSSASSKIGNPNAQATLTIGGSTTVYPLTQMAIAWFEQNNSNVVVADNQGGSGAGLLSLCAGQIQIAAMSRPVTSSDPAQCAANVVQTVIGYDAVSALVPASNPHGLVTISSQEMLTVYEVNGGSNAVTSTSSSNPVLGTTTTAKAGSVVIGATNAMYVPAFWGILQPNAAGFLPWNALPQHACFDPNIFATAEAGTVTNATVNGATVSFLTSALPAASTSACKSAWTYDTTSTSPTSPINVYGRSDNSGTEEAFDNNMIGIKCGSDNQLDSCGFSYTTALQPGGVISVSGNPALVAAIGKDSNALGFSSWGLSMAPVSQGGGGASSSGTTGGCTGSVVVCLVSFQGLASGMTPLVPSLSNIKAGIAAGYGNEVSGGFVGWRPLQYVTYGQPVGEEQRFIDFVTQPGTIQLLASENFFISYVS